MQLFLKNKLLASIVIVGLLIYCAIEAKGNGDFFIYMSAGGDLNNGFDIYTKKYLIDYHYYYSVLFALFLKPFYGLPFYGVKFCWLIINSALFIHLIYLLTESTLYNQLQTKTKKIFLLLVLLASFRFFHENIHASQITILILWCCIYSLVLIFKNKPFLGSLILTAGISIKLMPIVFLPYLFYRGFFKAFLLTVLFFGVTFILPSLFIGHAYNVELIQSWLKLINPRDELHVVDVYERSFHSIGTLLSTLCMKEVPDYYALPLRRHLFDVSYETLEKIILVARLCLVAFTLYFLKWWTLKNSIHKLQTPRLSHLIEISYILLIVPLIFPHQQHYAFLFMMPAFTCVIYQLLLNWAILPKLKKIALTVMLILIYLCGNLKILLGEFNRYYEHYKILTYGALLLIPLLVWASKTTGKNNSETKEHL